MTKLRRNRSVMVYGIMVLVIFNTLFMSAFIVPFVTNPNSTWSMKTAPLMTAWVEDIDPNNVLPEYPRPQMARADWLNLNGIWQFTPGEGAPTGHNYAFKILVPFAVESAISGIMQHFDRFWYHRTFDIPDSWAGKHVLLHFGAVDWEAEVFINGVSVGMHRGGYDQFEFDITPFLKDSPNELAVRVYDPSDAGYQPAGKQVLSPSGTFYSTVSGIWQTVWLEPVPETRITDLRLVPDIDNDCLNVTVSVSGNESGTVTVNATALNGTTVVGQASGISASSFSVPVPNPRLWSPADPFLYNLSIAVVEGIEILDSVDSYFGMRKISSGFSNGYHKMLLNGNFTFQLGPLDQGYWPDGLYTAPTDEALRWDIEAMKDLGFNMARKHMKVEPDRWYYWCDKLGLLVWQDMPFGRNWGSDGPIQFEEELGRMVESHWNHPSIVLWVVFNEGWGQYDTVRITNGVEALDPSRLVSCASGWTDFEVGDIKDYHQYPAPTCPVSKTRIVVNGEFGGIAWHVDQHSWSEEGWGYIGVTNQTKLAEIYESYLSQVKYLAENAGMSAAVYTQITDVEREVNGLVTYDRKVVKADVMRHRAANQPSLLPLAFQTVLNTSQLVGQNWSYTNSDPGSGWEQTGFDDSGWMSGPGGFGTWGTLGSIVRTTWNSPDIWLRKHFNPGSLTADQLAKLVFRMQHDDDVEIYINGVLAYNATGYITMYMIFDFNQDAKDAMVPDSDNVIAVHCEQDWGGQSIDVGIELLTSCDAVMNTSQSTGQVWNYTTSTPFTNWTATGFNDSSWTSGPGGFGTASTPNSVIGTTWSSSDIWLRRHFNPGPLTADQIENLVFKVHHDDGVEIYINGVLAYNATGYTSAYMFVECNQDGKSAIVANSDNVIAVHCHQEWGGQYIDLGLYVYSPS